MVRRKGVLLRIRPELYEVLQRWAADEFRSVNGHIEYLLHEAVRQAGRERKPGPERDVGGGRGAGDAPREARSPGDREDPGAAGSEGE